MRHSICIAACLGLALASSAAAQSPSFGTGTLNNLRMWANTPTGQTNVYACPNTPATIVGSCGLAGVGTVARASAAGGVLRAQSTLTLAQQGPIAPIPVDAITWGYTTTSYAYLYDRITFGGTPPAFLRFGYSLDGTRSTTSVDGVTNLAPGGRIYFGALQTTALQWTSPEVYLSKDDGRQSRTLPVDYDGLTDVGILGPAPLNVFLGVLATATINSNNLGAQLNGTVDADFSHTLTWSVRAYDAAGRDITDQAGIRFASSVPEPSTVALLATGLLATLGTAVRRRGRAG